MVLKEALCEWGYDVLITGDGAEAERLLQQADSPKVAILDWELPGRTGLDICRTLRDSAGDEPVYVIMLTGRDAKEDVVAALREGANDYVTKPFDFEELRARLEVGRQMVELRQSLTARVRELESALDKVNRLEGLLPICSYCRKVRDDQNYWQQVETYFLERSALRFSHGICPTCLERESAAFRAQIAGDK